MSCEGSVASDCNAQCEHCTMCTDRNSSDCITCQCCNSCLPLVSKCGFLNVDTGMLQFAFVGIYNRPSKGSEARAVGVDVELSLVADPKFVEDPLTWVAELWDRFHDISTLEVASRDIYPAGGQFIYTIELEGGSEEKVKVRVYGSRITLLHVLSEASNPNINLIIESGSDLITHVMTCARRLPKTLFDFDQVLFNLTEPLVIDQGDSNNVWILLLGGSDGESTILLAAGSTQSIGVMLLCIVALVAFILCLFLLGFVMTWKDSGRVHDDDRRRFVHNSGTRARMVEAEYTSGSGHWDHDGDDDDI